MTAAPRWPRQLLFSHRGVAHPAALLACNLVYPMCLSAHPVVHRFSRGTDKETGRQQGTREEREWGRGPALIVCRGWMASPTLVFSRKSGIAHPIGFSVLRPWDVFLHPLSTFLLSLGIPPAFYRQADRPTGQA